MLQHSARNSPKPGKQLKRAFFNRSVHKVAPDLIGVTLLVDGVGGIIVEVEAYHHTEPAAHSYTSRVSESTVTVRWRTWNRAGGVETGEQGLEPQIRHPECRVLPITPSRKAPGRIVGAVA